MRMIVAGEGILSKGGIERSHNKEQVSATAFPLTKGAFYVRTEGSGKWVARFYFVSSGWAWMRLDGAGQDHLLSCD
jgi:hypothetical protein